MQRRRENYKQLLKVLIEARRAAGLTQVQVGKILGKRQTFVSKYELGERRLDAIEFLYVCRAIKLNPAKTLSRFTKVL